MKLNDKNIIKDVDTTDGIRKRLNAKKYNLPF